MDGNGRWAKERGFLRVKGHSEGVHAVRDVTEACAELGISNLTLYTFSTENWNRPQAEINALMQLLIKALKREAKTFHENNIRLKSIGDVSQLPSACRKELREVISETAKYTGMTLTLALSYSGRWDIVQAMKSIAEKVKTGETDVTDINTELVSSHLSTAECADPDLLIRTGGDRRISNYMLWQMAYTELHFSPVFWPDFRREHLYDAIKDFQDRERRYGRVSDES